MRLIDRVEEVMGEYKGGVELQPSFSGKPDPTVMTSADVEGVEVASVDELLSAVEGEIEQAEEYVNSLRSDTAQISEEWGQW